MTTCTWDGKRLSADTRSITGGVIDQHACQKLFKKNGVVCAVAGNLSDAMRAVDFLLGITEKKPNDGDYEIMLVSKDRAEYYDTNVQPIPLATPFAIGSGRAEAMSAMLCGKTGKEAIKIAAKLDPNTSVDFGVRSYKI